MKSAKELRKELRQKLNELQDKCPHKETKWVPWSWAIGHYWGEVKICTFCEKVLEGKESQLTDSVSYDDWKNIDVVMAT